VLCEGGEPLAWVGVDGSACDARREPLPSRRYVCVLLHAMLRASLYSHHIAHSPTSISLYWAPPSGRDGNSYHMRKRVTSDRLNRFPDHEWWIVEGERSDAAPPPHDTPQVAGEGEDRQPLMHAADDAVDGLRGKHVRHLDRRWSPGGEAGVVRGRPSGANEKRERWRSSVEHPLAAWVGCRTRALLLLCDCGNEKRRDRYRVGVMPRYAMRGRRASGMGGGRRIGMRC
jgi:hypothetical protein